MTFIVFALLLILGVAAGVALGKWSARDKPELKRGERKELEETRALMMNVISVLAEGAVLGDHSAVKALDLIQKRGKA